MNGWTFLLSDVVLVAGQLLAVEGTGSNIIVAMTTARRVNTGEAGQCPGNRRPAPVAFKIYYLFIFFIKAFCYKLQHVFFW